MIINKISIIIPAFNEESTISIIADKLLNLYLVNNIKKEIIIVNDCSTDNTENLIQNIILWLAFIGRRCCVHEILRLACARSG